MKFIYFLFIAVAQAGLVFGAGRVLPGWISAKNKAFVSIAETSVVEEGEEKVLNVRASIVSDFTNNWKDGRIVEVGIPLRAEIISSLTDPWKIRVPEKGEKFYVFSNGSISDLKMPVNKVRINDAEIKDIDFILHLEKVDKGAYDKALELAKYVKDLDTSSVFLWQYLHYLISADSKCVDVLEKDILKMSNPDDCMHHVGEMMSEFGYMGQMTPEVRGLGKMIIARYLMATDERQLDEGMRISFRWVTKFKGASKYSPEEQTELKKSEGVIRGKGFEGLPDGFLNELFEERKETK